MNQSLEDGLSFFVFLEFLNDGDIIESCEKEFDHRVVSSGVIDLAFAEPVDGVVLHKVVEDLTVVGVLHEQSDSVVIELLRGNIPLELLSHFLH